MNNKYDMISCDCGNKFKVFDIRHYWRPISCTCCKRMWWVTCSGRRLISINMDFETFKAFMETAWNASAYHCKDCLTQKPHGLVR